MIDKKQRSTPDHFALKCLSTSEGIRLIGKIDFITAPFAVQRIQTLLKMHSLSTISIDFSAVTAANISSMAVLTASWRAARTFQKKVVFKNLPPMLCELVTLCHAKGFLLVEEKE